RRNIRQGSPDLSANAQFGEYHTALTTMTPPIEFLNVRDAEQRCHLGCLSRARRRMRWMKFMSPMVGRRIYLKARSWQMPLRAQGERGICRLEKLYPMRLGTGTTLFWHIK